MIVHRKLYLLAVIVGLIVTACAPASSAAPAVTSIPANIASSSAPAPWTLVAVGDSIPFNSSQDCPVCTGFVDRYAEAITAATGHPVTVQNLSQHTGLQIDDLLQTVGNNPNWQKALANADIIIVGIAHNDVAWGRDDDPCDGPTPDQPDWSKFNPTCAAAAAEIFRPKFESLYSQIVALRAGKPTIFRTINRYNDWAGTINSDGSHVPPEATNATRDVLDAWNSMICKAAQTNGFTCADIYHAFNGPDGLTFSGDLLAKDNTHPSDKGNEVIAKVLTDLGYAPLVP
jgi:lysophospholipase L1-like esterase